MIGTLLLQILDIHKKRLSGNILPELGITQTFKNMLLQNNMLIGTIPPEIFDSRSLIAFKIDDNELSGSIRSEVGNTENLFECEYVSLRSTIVFTFLSDSTHHFQTASIINIGNYCTK